MERVLGIGGYFLRTADPAAVTAWYRDCLGVDVDVIWCVERLAVEQSAYDCATPGVQVDARNAAAAEIGAMSNDHPSLAIEDDAVGH